MAERVTHLARQIEDSIPKFRHGYMLQRSVEGSWMRNGADMIPEEDILTDAARGMISQEILYSRKPFLDIEAD
eukprot:10907895-Karenia_brevis.AAC.1